MLHFMVYLGALILTFSAMGAECFHLEKSKPILTNLKRPGTESQRVELSDQSEILVKWGTGSPFISLATGPRVQALQLYNMPAKGHNLELIFTVTVRCQEPTPMRAIRLRLWDNTQKMFIAEHKIPNRKLPAGESRLHFTITGDNAIVWPLRLHGFIFDTVPNTPPGRLEITQAEYATNPEISISTGHPLHLLLPDNNQNPILQFRNPGTKELHLHGELKCGTVIEPELQSFPVDMIIAPNSIADLALIGIGNRQGAFVVHGELRSGDGRNIPVLNRFARMIPSGPIPGPPEGFIFGISAHTVSRFTTDEWRKKEALAFGLCGAKVARGSFRGSIINPAKDVFDFSRSDAAVDEFGKYHITWEPELSLEAKWAIDPNVPTLQERGHRFPKMEYYLEYVRRMVERYKGKVKCFEIDNEPDTKFFANYPAEYYIQQLEAADQVIKSIMPDAKTISGGLANAMPYLGKRYKLEILDYLRKNPGKHYDIFAFHKHGILNTCRVHLDELEKIGMIGPKAKMPWYLNESSMPTPINSFKGDLSQAEAVFSKLIYAWHRGSIGYVCYVMRDHIAQRAGRDFGMFTKGEPRAVYLCYNTLTGLFREATYHEQCAWPESIYSYRFTDRNGNTLYPHWGGDSPAILVFPEMPEDAELFDIFGNASGIVTDNGLAMLNVSHTPATLRLRGKKVSAGIPGTVLELPQLLAIRPDKSRNFTLHFNNPLERSLDFTVELKLPEALKSDGLTRRFKIAPGKNEAIKFVLNAGTTEKFTDSTSLGISITADKLPPQDFRIPVVLSESDHGYTFRLGRQEEFVSEVPPVPGNEAHYYRGPEDLSVVGNISLKPKAIHLSFKVTDDIQAKGDSVIFIIKLPNQDGYWHYRLELKNSGGYAHCIEIPTGFQNRPSKHVICAAARDEGKKLTTYECEVPFELIGFTPECIEKGIRFNVIFNDNDGPMHKGFLALAPGLGISNPNPGNYKVIYLDDSN